MKRTHHLVRTTSNPGKVREIGAFFRLYGLEAHPATDFAPLDIRVPDTGKVIGDNALIKATAYANGLSRSAGVRGQGFAVLADDTGIFIDALHGDPGINVRDWIGRPMSDQEIIDYALHRLHGLHERDRSAHFRTRLCMVHVDEEGKVGEPVFTEGRLNGHILEEASEKRVEGFPFESLFFSHKHQLMLHDFAAVSPEKKFAGILNHREQAFQEGMSFIRSVFGREMAEL